MKQDQKYFSFGRQVIYVLAANIIMLILGIIQMPVLTKGLGASLYGVWSLITTTISFIVPFAMLSFSMSIIRFLAAEKNKDKIREDFFSACSLVILAGFIFSLLVFVFSGFIATYILKDYNLTIYLKIGSVLILLNSLFPVLSSFFRKGSKIAVYSILNIGLSIAQTSLMILLISLGYRLEGMILASIISSLLLNIVAMTIIVKQIGIRRPHFSNMKSYLKWGIPLTPNTAMMLIMAASQIYIISYFKGISETGIYSAASGIGAYSSFALMPIGIVIYPIIARTYDEGNVAECTNFLKYAFKYLMAISIPAAVGLSILAKPLLQLLTTPEFISGSSVVALVAFGGIFNCLRQMCDYITHLVGKTHIEIIILSIAAVSNIILNIIFVPYMGIIGAGLSFFVTYGILGVLTLIVTRRYLRFDLNIPFVVKSLVSAVLMAVCIWLMKPDSIAMIGISVIVGVIVYFGLLILIRGFSKYELYFLKSFVRNSLKLKDEVK